MTARRYAVIDDANVVVNVIVVDDPMPDDFWPGYGMYLCYQGPNNPNEPDSAYTYSSKLAQFPKQPRFGPGSPDVPFYKLGIGDVISPANGTVFRFVPQQIVQEGQTVSSAPSVVLKNDANVQAKK